MCYDQVLVCTCERMLARKDYEKIRFPARHRWYYGSGVIAIM